MTDEQCNLSTAIDHPEAMPLDQFCDIIRQMESQGEDGIALLNDAIARGDAPRLIAQDEVQHSRWLEQITTDITRRFRHGTMRLVLVAGASCSGKTTTSRFLTHMLLDNGIEPKVVSIDNYFMDADKRPLDENGNRDYESFYGVDVKQLERDVNSLLAGDMVPIPTYDYVKGCRKYDGNSLRLESNNLLFLEGLHALNPELVPGVSDDRKYRLFVTAQTDLFGNEERAALTKHDNRLLRRIYRDYNSRGASALQTLQWWPGVLRGEERWILPFADQADACFNTSMVFELSAIKPRVQSLLCDVPHDEPEWEVARRLHALLDRIAPLSADDFAAIAPLRKFLLSNDGK